MRHAIALLITTALLSACVAESKIEVEPINPEADHVERWNWFVRALQALHERQLAGRELRTESRLGGYARQPEFYRETEYYDRKTGLLISRVQWEREHPDRIHSIETFVYDPKGRLLRDYGAWFLTHSRGAPQATIINLHAYNGELHAFRQFDATDNRLYEYCKGKLAGKPLEFEIWEREIMRLRGEPDTIMTTPEYRACFEGLPAKSAGKYLTPQ